VAGRPCDISDLRHLCRCQTLNIPFLAKFRYSLLRPPGVNPQGTAFGWPMGSPVREKMPIVPPIAVGSIPSCSTPTATNISVGSKSRSGDVSAPWAQHNRRNDIGADAGKIKRFVSPRRRDGQAGDEKSQREDGNSRHEHENPVRLSRLRPGQSNW
jgi:hypothetical protein